MRVARGTLTPWGSDRRARLRPRRPHARVWSPPLEMKCDSRSTYGGDFGVRRHLWRCPSDDCVPTGEIIAFGIIRRSRTAISPPMEMDCDCSSTHGGDFGFRRHLWRCPSDDCVLVGEIIALGIIRRSCTAISPPMEMDCDCSSTHGDGFGFRRHVWRCAAGAVARASATIAYSLGRGPRNGQISTHGDALWL